MGDQRSLGSDGSNVWKDLDVIEDSRLAYYADTGRFLGHSDVLVIARARRYIARIPGAVQGQRGSDATFAVACTLVHGFSLSPADALPLLQEWNGSCDPAWSTLELMHKLTSADRKRGAQRGYLLRPAPTNRQR